MGNLEKKQKKIVKQLVKQNWPVISSAAYTKMNFHFQYYSYKLIY